VQRQLLLLPRIPPLLLFIIKVVRKTPKKGPKVVERENGEIGLKFGKSISGTTTLKFQICLNNLKALSCPRPPHIIERERVTFATK
jgi:hypothetical protein